MVSVLILTQNEEKDLPACLQSINWCDDIHIIDSGSTDSTLEIAKNYNAKIYFNEFKSFGTQRNFALDNCDLKYSWVLFLDADERSTDAFKNEILNKISRPEDNISGFYCCWKMVLNGTWLKYSDNFPKWQFRLLKKGQARFTDFGHGQKEGEVTGEIGYIKSPYLHFGFSKGWTNWFEKHNKYSSLEATDRNSRTLIIKDIFSNTSSKRNPALKILLTKMPFWPLIRFIYTYIFKLGFLEGVEGFIYCLNMAIYEYLIVIKIRELKSKKI
jgi:glycosyltransferase involved in cell wall biosynthesis